MKEKILAVTKKIAEEMNIIIDNIFISSNDNRIKIIADTEQGIKLNELTNFSRALAEDIEFDKLIGEDYKYEITSPGIKSKLVKPYQFIRLRDKDIQIYFRNNKIVEGKLIEADREKIVIKDSNKKKNENTEYNYNEIKYAKLKLKW